MKRSRFTETQIISILNEVDAGLSVKEVSRKHGISEASFYNWKSKYGGMSANELKRLREMEEENALVRIFQVFAGRPDLSSFSTVDRNFLKYKLSPPPTMQLVFQENFGDV